MSPAAAQIASVGRRDESDETGYRFRHDHNVRPFITTMTGTTQTRRPTPVATSMIAPTAHASAVTSGASGTANGHERVMTRAGKRPGTVRNTTSEKTVTVVAQPRA